METKAPTLWMKLLTIPIVIIGIFCIIPLFYLPLGMNSAVVSGISVVLFGSLIVVGCFRGAKSCCAMIGFLLMIAILMLLNFLTISYPFQFLVKMLVLAALMLVVWFLSAARKNAVNRSQLRMPWWLAGTVFGGISLIIWALNVSYLSFTVNGFLACFLFPTIMVLYVCWLIWTDYRCIFISNETALRQNAAAVSYRSRQNTTVPAPTPASQPPRAALPGVTCPQCGSRIPTAGRTTGAVFCAKCGASVQLGQTDGVVDDALAEQIATLKRMRDADLITQEEFEAKKRQLLGI